MTDHLDHLFDAFLELTDSAKRSGTVLNLQLLMRTFLREHCQHGQPTEAAVNALRQAINSHIGTSKLGKLAYDFAVDVRDRRLPALLFGLANPKGNNTLPS